MDDKMRGRKAQTTLFIILAIVIVAGVILFFVLRGGTQNTNNNIPTSLEPVYSAFLSCVQSELETGIKLLETQGGYLDLPPFEPGSKYSPFSNQLNFAGVNIPYWYYVSRNNIQKEQVPTLNSMQKALSDFVSQRLNNCDLSIFRQEGFIINEGNATASAIIKEGVIEVIIKKRLVLSKGEDSASFTDHLVSVDTDLKSLYTQAKQIYEKEQSELFLEKYGEDDLRNYAPVDGVDFSCAPLTWNAPNVFNDLRAGIEANVLAINIANDKYFSWPDSNVRFINSRNWSSKIDVAPSEGPLMIAKPVGNQPGVGILGFCYVPYHFVYDVYYPVLVQVGSNEIFQFPVSVIIKGNLPREPISSAGFDTQVSGLCDNKNTKMDVSVLDIHGSSIDGSVSYECADTECYIGEAKGGRLTANFPQCVGGSLIVQSEEYEIYREPLSVVNSGEAQAYLRKKYEIGLRILVDGKPYAGSAFVTFNSNDSSSSAYYPDQKTVELSQGQYDVEVSIYDEANLELPASIQQQCVDVPNGVLGILGLTKEKCFDITVPDQIISNVLSGGGSSGYYVLDSQLSVASIIEIDSPSLTKPTSLDELQTNYLLFDGNKLDISLR